MQGHLHNFILFAVMLVLLIILLLIFNVSRVFEGSDFIIA